MANNPVTDYDRRIVREMWTDEHCLDDIAARLNRAHGTIQYIAASMALGPKPVKPAPSEWTAEMVEFLRVEWFGGASASNAAKSLNARFGTYFTRNATIGKVHRSGFIRPEEVSNQNKRRNGLDNIRLANGPKPPPRAKPVKASQKPVKTAVANPKATYGANDNIREAWVIVTDAAWDILPGSEPKTLLNRRNFGECKFPVGLDEPEQRFCCIKTDQTYCMAHRALMYRPPTKGEKDALRGRGLLQMVRR